MRFAYLATTYRKGLRIILLISVGKKSVTYLFQPLKYYCLIRLCLINLTYLY